MNNTKSNVRSLRSMGADENALALTPGVIIGFVLAVVVFGAVIGTALNQLDVARASTNATNLGVAGLFSVIAVVAIIIFIAMLAKHAE